MNYFFDTFQRKVTKREALNRTRLLAGHWLRAKTLAQILGRSDPLRSRCCPYDERHRLLRRGA